MKVTPSKSVCVLCDASFDPDVWRAAVDAIDKTGIDGAMMDAFEAQAKHDGYDEGEGFAILVDDVCPECMTEAVTMVREIGNTMAEILGGAVDEAMFRFEEIDVDGMPEVMRP